MRSWYRGDLEPRRALERGSPWRTKKAPEHLFRSWVRTRRAPTLRCFLGPRRWPTACLAGSLEISWRGRVPTPRSATRSYAWSIRKDKFAGDGCPEIELTFRLPQKPRLGRGFFLFTLGR